MKLSRFLPCLVLLLAPPAFGASPGPSAREATLGLGTCLGGGFDGETCVDDGDCDDGSPGDPATCTSNVLDLEIRAFLTIFLDKDSGDYDSVDTVPYVSKRSCADGPFQGEPCEKNSDCRTPNNDKPICREELVPEDPSQSTLTLLLEFNQDGRRFAFAETYRLDEATARKNVNDTLAQLLELGLIARD